MITEILIIGTILLIGIIMLVLEIYVIPGTTVFGFIGGGLMIAAVVFAYHLLGNTGGHITLAAASLMGSALLFLGLRSLESERFAMKDQINARVNELGDVTFNLGDQGVAISELRPSGKAKFDHHKVEVFSQGEFIEKDSQIIIISIDRNKIIVKKV